MIDIGFGINREGEQWVLSEYQYDFTGRANCLRHGITSWRSHIDANRSLEEHRKGISCLMKTYGVNVSCECGIYHNIKQSIRASCDDQAAAWVCDMVPVCKVCNTIDVTSDSDTVISRKVSRRATGYEPTSIWYNMDHDEVTISMFFPGTNGWSEWEEVVIDDNWSNGIKCKWEKVDVSISDLTYRNRVEMALGRIFGSKFSKSEMVSPVTGPNDTIEDLRGLIVSVFWSFGASAARNQWADLKDHALFVKRRK